MTNNVLIYFIYIYLCKKIRYAFTMTINQLKSVMKFQLKNFNDENVEVNNQTIHNQILESDDGYGNANSKSIYKLAIRWTLRNNGHEDVAWPRNWIDLSVNELAPKLIEA